MGSGDTSFRESPEDCMEVCHRASFTTPSSVSLLSSELLDDRSMPNPAHGTQKVGQQFGKSLRLRDISHHPEQHTNDTGRLSFKVKERIMFWRLVYEYPIKAKSCDVFF